MLAPKDLQVADRRPDLHLLPSTPGRRRWASSVKRAVDVSLAAFVLIPALPLMGVLTVIIVLADRQLPFYADTRVGLAGRRFRCWKFRTMRSDPRILQSYFAAHPAEEALYRTTRKLDRDPRITPLGRLLRKASIDEIPQIWNVLRGQMSIVGPRPLSPSEFEARGSSRFVLASVRPGMTGLWQVNGRSNLDPASRVLLDNYYARNWSVWMDVRIMALTPVVVLTARGAR